MFVLKVAKNVSKRSSKREVSDHTLEEIAQLIHSSCIANFNGEKPITVCLKSCHTRPDAQ